MNCTQQDLQLEQTGDIIQIIILAFTVIPLIASEILPFLPCDSNGLVHGIVLALSKMKPSPNERATRASIDAHPRP